MEEHDPKTVPVYVECDGTVCRLTPKEVPVRKGDEIEFVNNTDDEIRIQFSEYEVLDADKDKVTAKSSKKKPVQGNKVGLYPYAVFCKCIDDFAVAGSLPIIIIIPG